MITFEELSTYPLTSRRQLFSWLMQLEVRAPNRMGKTVRVLVDLRVGHSAVVPTNDPSIKARNIYHSKRTARVFLKDPEAQWTSRSVDRGLLVTRVR